MVNTFTDVESNDASVTCVQGDRVELHVAKYDPVGGDVSVSLVFTPTEARGLGDALRRVAEEAAGE
jgi:hypothetical protein